MQTKNRSFTIATRLLIVVTCVGYVHFWARIVYAANAWQGLSVDSFMEYTDNIGHIAATHLMGLLIGAIILVVLGGAVALIRWVFDIAPSNVNQQNTDNPEDDVLHCTDRLCRCIYHREEYFDLTEHEWLSWDCKNPDCKCNYHADEQFDVKATAWQ